MKSEKYDNTSSKAGKGEREALLEGPYANMCSIVISHEGRL